MWWCKVIPKKFQHPDQNGVTQVFYPNQNLGKHKIRQLFKKGAAILDIPNAKDFCASSLRSMFITNLANGDGASLRECMDSSRHNSVAASNIYQERDSKSETNKFKALGIVPKKRERSKWVRI